MKGGDANGEGQAEKEGSGQAETGSGILIHAQS